MRLYLRESCAALVTIGRMERVQKRFATMSLGLEGSSYKERLYRLGLFFPWSVGGRGMAL